MVGRTPSGLTPKEMQLYRLLSHAADCTDHPCAECENVLRRMEDGPQHFLEDHELRLEKLGEVLRSSRSVAQRLADHLEGAAVQQPVRRAAFWLSDALEAAVKLLTEPIYAKPAAPRAGPSASPTRPVRRPVTIVPAPPKPRVIVRRAVTLTLVQGAS